MNHPDGLLSGNLHRIPRHELSAATGFPLPIDLHAGIEQEVFGLSAGRDDIRLFEQLAQLDGGCIDGNVSHGGHSLPYLVRIGTIRWRESSLSAGRMEKGVIGPVRRIRISSLSTARRASSM